MSFGGEVNTVTSWLHAPYCPNGLRDPDAFLYALITVDAIEETPFPGSTKADYPATRSRSRTAHDIKRGRTCIE
jgi:hypothetical protein